MKEQMYFGFGTSELDEDIEELSAGYEELRQTMYFSKLEERMAG